MAVWIDVTTAASSHPPATGISRVELNLAEALCETDPHIQLCLYESQLGRFSALARTELRHIGDVQRSSVAVKGLMELDVERRDMRHAGGLEIFRRGDVLITCGLNWLSHMGNMPRLYAMQSLVGLRLITTCYDIIPIKFTHVVPGMDVVFAPYMREMIRHANHVLCISRCTERDLLRWTQSIGERRPETSVMPLGCRLRPLSTANVSDTVAKIAARRFLLCVSTIESRKNQQTLCRAYTRLVDWGVTDLPLLVLAGAVGHGGQALIDEIAADRRLAGRVITLVGCSDTDLAALYRGCLFTLYPSVYEGWGLPVSEGLGYGKFCLCSNQGALPEAGQEFADYADPWNVDEWANKIYRYITISGALEQRESEIEQCFEAPTWQASAAHVLAVASRLAQK
jgi:glycosyltransferase involved in cell wall biosynthesis